jgi:hypothetical protein
MKSGLVPRLGDLIYVCILAACLLIGQRMLNTDSDIGRHLALGRYMLESGRIPTRDILSFTRMGESRPPYEWLSQVSFALAERVLRIDGVVFLTACLIAAAFLTVYVDARERGGGALVALGLTIWAALAASLHWLTRPHVFTFVFLAVWLLLLDRLRRGDRHAVWELPLVMLFWANFHGGFVFGFVAWSAYVLGWIIHGPQHRSQSGSARQLVFVGVASFVASLLTPGLGASWVAVVANFNPYILSRTAETAPVSWLIPGTWPFIGLVLLALFLGIRNRRRLVAAHGLLLMCTGLMAIGTMRNIPLFCLAAVPILAAWERGDSRTETVSRRFEARMSAIDLSSRGYLWAVGATLIAAVFLAGRTVAVGSGLYGFEPRQFPVEAVDWAVEHDLHGLTFNDVNWGGYLLYRRWPEHRVFIDSQSDFYGEPFFREYDALYLAADDWQNALDQHGITDIVLPPSAPLAIQLKGDPAWAIAFQDSTAVVLLRRED